MRELTPSERADPRLNPNVVERVMLDAGIEPANTRKMAINYVRQKLKTRPAPLPPSQSDEG